MMFLGSLDPDSEASTRGSTPLFEDLWPVNFLVLTGLSGGKGVRLSGLPGGVGLGSRGCPDRVGSPECAMILIDHSTSRPDLPSFQL